MATDLSTGTAHEIEVVKARIQLERKHLRASIDAIPRLLRDAFPSRNGLVGAFLVAAFVGVLSGMRTRSAFRRSRLK
jgi:hypothetical protein